MIDINTKLDSKLKVNNKRKNKKQGFTLMELIVVVAIIAILAASLTPSFTGYIKESRKVAVINQAKNVVTAYESINAKTTNEISTNISVSSFITSYGNDLINATDLQNIEIDTITIQDCINALDSDRFMLKLDNSNKLSSPPTIIPTTTTTE